MRKADDLIGKTIIHHDTGNTLAVVHDVLFDAQARNVIALVIQSGGWLKHARVVPWGRVVTVGDFIFVQGEQPILVSADDPELVAQGEPMGRISGTPIMSDSGERLGKAGDLFIDDVGKVVGIEVKQGYISLADRKFLPADHVHAVGSDAVIADMSDLPSLAEADREADRGTEGTDQLRDRTGAEAIAVRPARKNFPQPASE